MIFAALLFALFGLAYAISAIEEPEKFAGSCVGKFIASVLVLAATYLCVYASWPATDQGVDGSTKLGELRRKADYLQNFKEGSPYTNVSAYTVEFTDGSSTKRVVHAGQHFYVEVKR